jgi:hypothetical protein
VKINDKHIEVIVRQMLRRVQITDAGDTDYIVGEQVERSELLEENDRVNANQAAGAVRKRAARSPRHQDLSIPVRERVDHPLLRGWSEKEGSVFVQPPVDVLQQLVAVRLHLDPCMEEDGPLQLVAGSHTLGGIPPDRAGELKRDGPVVTCALDRRGVLMMRPLALHASSKAMGNGRRRVLHFMFGPRELP